MHVVFTYLSMNAVTATIENWITEKWVLGSHAPVLSRRAVDQYNNDFINATYPCTSIAGVVRGEEYILIGFGPNQDFILVDMKAKTVEFRLVRDNNYRKHLATRLRNSRTFLDHRYIECELPELNPWQTIEELMQNPVTPPHLRLLKKAILNFRLGDKQKGIRLCRQEGMPENLIGRLSKMDLSV